MANTFAIKNYRSIYQIPPDLVMKSQAIDVVGVIVQRL
jgi:hypothetical protein